jgi:hypothetical protein
VISPICPRGKIKINTRSQQAEAEPQAHSHTGNTDSTTALQVTHGTLSQFRGEIKKEFMALLQQEVKVQIKQEMISMQTQVAQLSTQLVETMQHSIQGIHESQLQWIYSPGRYASTTADTTVLNRVLPQLHTVDTVPSHEQKQT